MVVHESTVRLWDNSNIIESFPGVIRPLTYSLAREAYAGVYRGAARLLGVSQATVDANAPLFDELLGYIEGRVYYNVSHWHSLLALLPGFATNQPLLERMMGASRPGAKPTERAAHVMGSRLARLALVNMALRSAVGVALFERRARAFERTVAGLGNDIRRRDLERLPADALLEAYDEVSRRAIRAWPVTIFNDLAVMVVHGGLRRTAESWAGPSAEAAVNRLLRGEGLASTAPALELRTLADLLRRQPAALADLRASEDPLAMLHADNRLAEARRGFDAYLQRWGDRCPRELELDQPSYAEDPQPLLASLLDLAAGERPAAIADHAADRADAWRLLRRQLRPRRGVRRLVRLRALSWLVRRARYQLAWRERMRFARTEVFAVGRRLFGELGRRFVALGFVDEPGDIHYLDIVEIRGLMRGTLPLPDVRRIVAERRQLLAGFAASPPPPDRFETVGPVGLFGWRQAAAGGAPVAPAVAESSLLLGTPVSGGVVRGRCRVVIDPRGDRPAPTEIVVARSTDPGWLPLLMSASGLLVERGSLLSHSAIVARELGLPAIVGLAGLMSRLNDGDLIEMDGQAGTVRVLEEDARR